MKVWLVNLRRELFKPSKKTVVCCDHFTPESFDRTGQTIRLRKDAVPTRFDFPKHLQKKAKTRKPPRCRTTIVTTNMEDFAEGPSPTPLDDAALLASKASVGLDHQYHIVPESPRKQKRRIDSIIDRANCISNKLRLSAQRSRRLQQRVTSLKVVIADLKDKNLISDSCEEILSASFAGIPLSLMLRMLKRKQTGKIPRTAYPEELKTFALTLNFYSPKAYSYVRDTVRISIIIQFWSTINFGQIIIETFYLYSVYQRQWEA